MGQTILDRYRIDELVGRGGTALVVRAFDLKMNDIVALKVLLPEHAHDAGFRMRFQREASALASIDSRFAPRIFESTALADGTPIVVMEFLTGEDLQSRMARPQPIPVATACRWIVEACDAIAAAHHLGVIHRDIKPANLFLASSANDISIRVVDFGISKATHVTSVTQASTMLGTPHYMPPEQLRSSTAVDARADVYALGAVLYHILAGRRPFDGGTLLELGNRILFETAPALPDAVPTRLATLVLSCLDKSPAKRPQSVVALMSELAPFTPDSEAAEKLAARHDSDTIQSGVRAAIRALTSSFEFEPPTAAERQSLSQISLQHVGTGAVSSQTAADEMHATNPEMSVETVSHSYAQAIPVSLPVVASTEKVNVIPQVASRRSAIEKTTLVVAAVIILAAGFILGRVL